LKSGNKSSVLRSSNNVTIQEGAGFPQEGAKETRKEKHSRARGWKKRNDKNATDF